MSKIKPPRFLKKFFDSAISKRAHLQAAERPIETLALGNSQGDNSFDTRVLKGSFNLCSRSQDLKYSFLLYEKVGLQLKDLKRVVLYYSFISPGFALEENRGEQGMALALNEVFKLGVEFEDDYLANLADDLSGIDDSDTKIFDGLNGFFPQAYRTYFNEPYWEERRASELLEFNKKEGSIAYLYKLMALAKVRGHELFFVIPPNREDFTSSVGLETEYLHRHLFEVMSRHGINTSTHLLDLYHEQALVGEDFEDYNHVRPDSEATKEMTRRLVQVIEALV